MALTFFIPINNRGEGLQNGASPKTITRSCCKASISCQPGRFSNSDGLIFSNFTPTQVRKTKSGCRLFTSSQSVLTLARSSSANTFRPPANSLNSVNQLFPPAVNTGFGHHSQYIEGFSLICFEKFLHSS